jgi:hypothetical protein
VLRNLINRYPLEIAGVLLLKLLLIVAIKLIWFSDRPAISDQAVADRLLSPASTTASQRKSHD